MMLERDLRKHDRRPIGGQACSWMVSSENLAADLTGQPTYLALIHITQSVKVLMEQCVEHVGVQVPPVLCQMCYLVKEASVHNNEVGAQLVKRANIVGKVRQPQHQPCSASSQACLDGFLDELEYVGEVEASIEAIRQVQFWDLRSDRAAMKPRVSGYLRTGFSNTRSKGFPRATLEASGGGLLRLSRPRSHSTSQSAK